MVTVTELLESLVRNDCRVRQFGQLDTTLEDLYLKVGASSEMPATEL